MIIDNEKIKIKVDQLLKTNKIKIPTVQKDEIDTFDELMNEIWACNGVSVDKINQIQKVEKLITKMSDEEIRKVDGWNGWTALHALGQIGGFGDKISELYSVKLALILLNKAPDLIDVKAKKYGDTALDVAIGHNNVKLIETFLEFKPSLVNNLSDTGMTILHSAATYCNSDIVAKIVSKMNPELINLGTDGYTALYFATAGRARDTSNAEIIFNRMSVDGIKKTLKKQNYSERKEIEKLIDKVIIASDKSIEYNCTNFEAYHRKGQMLDVLDKKEEAQEYYKKAEKVLISQLQCQNNDLITSLEKVKISQLQCQNDDLITSLENIVIDNDQLKLSGTTYKEDGFSCNIF